MRVYRVETDAGVGPYADWTWCSVVGLPLCDTEKQPGPGEDGMVGWTDGRHYFGFRDEHQLKDWFGEWLEALADAEFLVSVYDVPDEHVVHGSKQVAFVRDVAEHVESKHVLEVA